MKIIPMVFKQYRDWSTGIQITMTELKESHPDKINHNIENIVDFIMLIIKLTMIKLSKSWLKINRNLLKKLGRRSYKESNYLDLSK